MKQILAFFDNIFANFGQPQFAHVNGFKFDIKPQVQEDEKLKNIMFKKGGTTVVEKPTYTPPPPAPAPASAATQEAAMTPEEEAKRKLEAQKAGAKSLQIPVTGATAGTAQVGTGTS
jgi:hypothetical protein